MPYRLWAFFGLPCQTKQRQLPQHQQSTPWPNWTIWGSLTRPAHELWLRLVVVEQTLILVKETPTITGLAAGGWPCFNVTINKQNSRQCAVSAINCSTNWQVQVPAASSSRNPLTLDHNHPRVGLAAYFLCLLHLSGARCQIEMPKRPHILDRVSCQLKLSQLLLLFLFVLLACTCCWLVCACLCV